MTDQVRRAAEVLVQRVSSGSYRAVNARGGQIRIGTGEGEDFTPVELLLAAIAGCASVDVDLPATRRAEPERFVAAARGTLVRDDRGNRLEEIVLELDAQFPDSPDGERASRMVASLLQQAHDRLCTVSRTVEAGTPVEMRLKQGE